MSSAPEIIDVLVVDDSAVVRQLMSGLLGEGQGFRVVTASDPLVAMAKMRRQRPTTSWLVIPAGLSTTTRPGSTVTARSR